MFHKWGVENLNQLVESLGYEIQKSKIDQSVNFVQKQDVGILEARYVRRAKDYFVIYISSQSGCGQGCRMCHLTRTGQMRYMNATKIQIIEQAKQVMDYYKECEPAQTVHYNFMARGEPLDSPNVDGELLLELAKLATDNELYPKFKISTIMPKGQENIDLAKRFSPMNPDIYYSFYSTSPQFRRIWLPRAMDYKVALNMLKEYQQKTHKLVKIHGPLIDGKNSSISCIDGMVDAIKNEELNVDWNIVRYNPFADRWGAEAPDHQIRNTATYIKKLLPSAQVKIIPKVGQDVYASCGMFVDSDLDD